MPKAIPIWICCCAYLNCAGWTLSALHQLNAAGYGAALAIFIVAAFIWKRSREGREVGKGGEFQPSIPSRCSRDIDFKKYLRRFRRPLPAIFLLVAVLIFLGGVLYAPNNYDALTYRLPRMLNWLAAGHWFWIPTVNERMNYSATAWEWMAMPLLALLRSDRSLFLINALGFLLMPGLLFSVFRQLGVARKVAWTWMWILPLAYGCATQAGSIGNDFTGALFCLMSVHCGLRARRSGQASDIWLAALAAALMTGVKLSNLPLLLPCLVAIWPALGQLRKNLAGSVVVAGIAVVVSAAPTIVLNQAHTGSWNGDPQNLAQVQVKSPGAALLGNSLLVLQQSLMPPVLPAAQKVDGWLDRQLPASWRHLLEEGFPRYSGNHLNELPQEEAAALGLGVTLLLLTAIGATVCGLGRAGSRRGAMAALSPVGLAAWVSAFFFMLKMGSEADARLMLPYYPLVIIPILLLPAQNHLLHFRAWRILLVLAALSVLPAVVLSPARPLWPAQKISERLARQHPGNPSLQRLATVYSAYAGRNDALAPLRAGLPDGILKIGFFAGSNDTDYSLWRPFGSRQIEYLQTGAARPVLVPDDVEWIVIKRAAWTEAGGVPLETWAAQHHAKITLSAPIVTLVAWGEQDWCVLHIEKP
jgi:hypothetical protein